MSSFQISVTPRRRAVGRFVAGVRRALNKALAEEHNKRGLTQAELARAIETSRSVVNRQLRGTDNLSLSRVGELAWALGRTISLSFDEIEQDESANCPLPVAGTFTVVNSGTHGVARAQEARALEAA